MTLNEIIEKVKQLNLPKNSYIVFGSCPLALAKLRDANDIDMLVSESVFKKLEHEGWSTIYKGPADKPLSKGDFEIHMKWDFSSYKPTLEHLLASADYKDGIPFASLKEVRKWKLASGRPKDIDDINLIDAYLQS
jgi:hypothetical protein